MRLFEYCLGLVMNTLSDGDRFGLPTVFVLWGLKPLVVCLTHLSVFIALFLIFYISKN